jgi:hypothetical protein
MNYKNMRRLPQTLAATAVLGSLLGLAGCAGDPPTAQLAVTNQAVNAAETAGATEFAPVEMQSARDKLNTAEKAEQEKDYKEARRLAEQAEWDARVAERKAQAQKAQRAVQDAQKGVQELREEGLRNAN